MSDTLSRLHQFETCHLYDINAGIVNPPPVAFIARKKAIDEAILVYEVLSQSFKKTNSFAGNDPQSIAITAYGENGHYWEFFRNDKELWDYIFEVEDEGKDLVENLSLEEILKKTKELCESRRTTA